MTFSEWNIKFILFTVGNTLHIEVYEVNEDDMNDCTWGAIRWTI